MHNCDPQKFVFQMLKILFNEVGQTNAHLRNFISIIFAKRGSLSKTIFWFLQLQIIVFVTLKFIMLNLVHDTHIGVVRIKSLTRLCVCLPNIDADIKHIRLLCVTCFEFERFNQVSFVSLILYFNSLATFTH